MTSTVDIRELILDEEAVDSMASFTPKKKAAVKPTIEYAQVVGSGTDFAIRKKSARTDEMMVVNVSKSQYYIKHTDGTIETLTPESMRKFLGGIDTDNDFEITGVNWLNKIYKTKKYCEDFIAFLEFTPYLHDDYLFFNPVTLNHGDYSYSYRKCKSVISNFDDILKYVRKVFPEVSTERFFKTFMMTGYMDNSTRVDEYLRYLGRVKRFLQRINDNFGLENMRDFISSYKKLPMPIALGPQYSDDTTTDYQSAFFGAYNFEYRAFRDYTLHHALTEGYVDESMYNQWRDTLMLQRQVYGKVREKYPEHLNSMHHKLSYLNRRNNKDYDIDKWKKVYDSATYLEYKGLNYVSIIPTDKAALCDEAMQQGNCVAGYFDKMLNGESIIVFLRKRSTPDISWITVEVKDGAIIQAETKFCQSLTEHEMITLNKFAKEKSLRVEI